MNDGLMDLCSSCEQRRCDGLFMIESIDVRNMTSNDHSGCGSGEAVGFGAPKMAVR